MYSTSVMREPSSDAVSVEICADVVTSANADGAPSVVPTSIPTIAMPTTDLCTPSIAPLSIPKLLAPRFRPVPHRHVAVGRRRIETRYGCGAPALICQARHITRMGWLCARHSDSTTYVSVPQQELATRTA